MAPILLQTIQTAAGNQEKPIMETKRALEEPQKRKEDLILNFEGPQCRQVSCLFTSCTGEKSKNTNKLEEPCVPTSKSEDFKGHLSVKKLIFIGASCLHFKLLKGLCFLLSAWIFYAGF